MPSPERVQPSLIRWVSFFVGEMRGRKRQVSVAEPVSFVHLASMRVTKVFLFYTIIYANNTKNAYRWLHRFNRRSDQSKKNPST